MNIISSILQKIETWGVKRRMMKTIKRVDKNRKSIVDTARTCKWFHYEFMLEMEREYLRYMREGFLSELPHSEDASKKAHLCEILINVIDIAVGKFDIDRHVNLKNSHRFISAQSVKDNNELLKEGYESFVKMDVYPMKALALYNEMRLRYMGKLFD